MKLAQVTCSPRPQQSLNLSSLSRNRLNLLHWHCPWVAFDGELSRQTIPPLLIYFVYVASIVFNSAFYFQSPRCFLGGFRLGWLAHRCDWTGSTPQEGQVLQLRPDGVRHGSHRQLQGLPDVRRSQAMAGLPGVSGGQRSVAPLALLRPIGYSLACGIICNKNCVSLFRVETSERICDGFSSGSLTFCA